MKVDSSLLVADPGAATELVQQLEQAGVSGVYTFEGQHDPFLPLAIAAQSTQRIDLIRPKSMRRWRLLAIR